MCVRAVLERLTRSPWQSSLLLVVALVALAEVEQNEHVQHHPHQGGGQDHLAVGKPPHPTSESGRRTEQAVNGEECWTFRGLFPGSPECLVPSWTLSGQPSAPLTTTASLFHLSFCLSLSLLSARLSAPLQMVTFTLGKSLRMTTVEVPSNTSLAGTHRKTKITQFLNVCQSKDFHHFYRE